MLQSTQSQRIRHDLVPEKSKGSPSFTGSLTQRKTMEPDVCVHSRVLTPVPQHLHFEGTASHKQELICSQWRA